MVWINAALHEASACAAQQKRRGTLIKLAKLLLLLLLLLLLYNYLFVFFLKQTFPFDKQWQSQWQTFNSKLKVCLGSTM